MKIYKASIYESVPYEPDILIWENYYLSSAKAEEAIAVEQAKIEPNPDKWESCWGGSSSVTIEWHTYDAIVVSVQVLE